MMTLDEAAARLRVEPTDHEALRVLVDAIDAAVGRAASSWRAFGPEDRDDVRAELIKKMWVRVTTGTLPTEALGGTLVLAARNLYIDLSRRRKARRIAEPGPEEHAPHEDMGAPGVMEYDPLAALRAAYEAARAARREADRPHIEQAWRRYWRVIDEATTLRDVILEEGGSEADVSAGQRAHARMTAAILEAAEPSERALLRELLHLRGVR